MLRWKALGKFLEYLTMINRAAKTNQMTGSGEFEYQRLTKIMFNKACVKDWQIAPKLNAKCGISFTPGHQSLI